MTALLGFILLMGGALGAGSITLHVSGIRKTLSLSEDFAISLSLGAGFIGWLAFFPGIIGYFSQSTFTYMLLFPCIGLIPMWMRLRGASMNCAKASFSMIEKIMIGGLAIIIFFDLAEAISPQADADTMAYHFATPSLFLHYGKLEFIPRAIDGAVPLLQQLGYGVALSLGGELLANLWLAVTGWAIGIMTFVTTLRLSTRTWALVCTLVVMTTPAIIYGAGTGQVEARSAAYVIVAAFAVLLAIKEDHLGFAFIAAIAAGLFFGTKYTGLLIGFACGIVFLLHGRRYFRHTVVFSFVAVVVGAQWYAFNYYHTGDPIFPLLWNIVDYPVNFPWSDAQNLHIKELNNISESPLAKNLIWFFLYPFLATLEPLPQFGSSRVGLGITWLLLLPLALAGAWQRRHSFLQSSAAIFIAIGLIYYVVWFFFGTSQRVRHLLPVYPLVLIALVCLSSQAINCWQTLRFPCAFAIIAVLLVQFGGYSLFSFKYIDYVASKTTSTAFLQRNIVGYDVVIALNTILNKNDRVLVTYRPWLYRLNVPYFYAHPDLQDEVSLRPENVDPRLFLKQLENKRITHVVTKPSDLNNMETNSPLQKLMISLQSNTCAKIIRQIEVLAWPSRTLQLKSSRMQEFLIYKITRDSCTLL